MVFYAGPRFKFVTGGHDVAKGSKHLPKTGWNSNLDKNRFFCPWQSLAPLCKLRTQALYELPIARESSRRTDGNTPDNRMPYLSTETITPSSRAKYSR